MLQQIHDLQDLTIGAVKYLYFLATEIVAYRYCGYCGYCGRPRYLPCAARVLDRVGPTKQMPYHETRSTPPDDPSLIDIAALVAAFGTDLERGLGVTQAAKRLHDDDLGCRLIRRSGQPRGIFAIVFLCAALAKMPTAASAVLDGGAVVRVFSTELVKDNLLLLAEGEAVGADARLVQAAALTLLAAPVTSESGAVLKDAARAVTPTNSTLDLAAVDRFIIAQMKNQRIPGLALAITHKDQVVYVRGYGTARKGEPVTEKTQFRIASLSKSFTALAVLQLVEAGQINLDTAVSHYLPDFTVASPVSAGNITVRQLLNHTSGLADAGFIRGLMRQQQTLADRIASLSAAQLVDPPGVAFHYFDPNYQVLARLVEVVSGQAFDAYLQAHIFTPLAMHESTSALTSDLSARRANHLAQGHILIYGMPLATPELSGFLGGSGGVVSTATDMAHYLIAQNNGGRYADRNILSAKNIALMQTPATGIASSYAMGWVAADVHGIQIIEHNGILSTFYSEAVLLPKSGYGFALLYNQYALTSSTLAFPVLKNGLVALLNGEKPPSHGLTVPMLGFILGAFSILGVGLTMWSLLRLPHWAAHASSLPRWQLALGLIWVFAPAILLLALPLLLAQLTGRFFGYVMLARAMPEVIIFLGVCGGIGALNGVARLFILIRHAQRR